MKAQQLSNLWNSVKAVLRKMFIAIQAYLKKQEKNQINNLTLHLKQIEKEEMKNTRVSRRKEILKIGNLCTPMADSCQCMAKPIQYCKAK